MGCSDKWEGLCFTAALHVLTLGVWQGFEKFATVLGPPSLYATAAAAAAALTGVCVSCGNPRLRKKKKKKPQKKPQKTKSIRTIQQCIHDALFWSPFQSVKHHVVFARVRFSESQRMLRVFT